MALSVPQPGEVIADKYEVVRLLGKGGMGVVLEARHRKLDQRVALKFLAPAELEQAGAVQRFEREARAAALLRSPHVVRTLDVDQTPDGLPFIVMEYLDGRDASSELVRRGRIPVDEAVDWMLQACVGMREAHASGIIHRDLKPSNLFLCTTPGAPLVVKVMDFGVSKVSASHGETTELTSTQTTLGTPSYMAPEQLVSAKTIDARADVWSLGVVLYRLLTGALPFTAPTPTALAIAVATTDPVDVATRGPWLPAELCAAIMKCLRREPQDRFADVGAFAAAIERFGSGRYQLPKSRQSAPQLPAPEAAPRVDGRVATLPTAAAEGATASAWDKPAIRARRGPPLLAILGVAAALGALGIGFSVYHARKSAPPAANATAPPEPSETAAPAEIPTANPPATTTAEPTASAIATTPPPRPNLRRPLGPPPVLSVAPPKHAPSASTSDPLHL